LGTSEFQELELLDEVDHATVVTGTLTRSEAAEHGGGGSTVAPGVRHPRTFDGLPNTYYAQGYALKSLRAT